MQKNSKIFIAGHRGMAGSAILRSLKQLGYTNIITRTRAELDLLDFNAVTKFFKNESPEFIFLAAAKVGGIIDNVNYPANYIYENLQIQNNVIHNAYLNNIKKLLFLGSSCIYPKNAPQPIKEEYLLTGPLEPTNKSYAIAKIAGLTMCESYNKQYGTNFISVMPTNLYGPNDNFDLKSSHALPALIRKFHDAKINNDSEVMCWGTGKPKREFLHVNDLADACIFLMKNYNESEIINIGTGIDITIKKLAEIIKKETKFKGEIKWDTSKPNGTPRKLLNVDKIHTVGWKYKIDLETGIKNTYKWYKNSL